MFWYLTNGNFTVIIPIYHCHIKFRCYDHRSIGVIGKSADKNHGIDEQLMIIKNK